MKSKISYLSNNSQDKFKNYADSWVKWEKKYKDNLKASVDKYLINYFDLNNSGKVICDFGYGKGRFLKQISNYCNFKKIYGFEVNPYLRQSDNNFYELTTFQKFESIVPELDYLISTSVIQLLNDQELSAFFESISSLKENSKAILIYPNNNFSGDYLEKDTSWYTAKETTFCRSDNYLTEFVPSKFQYKFDLIRMPNANLEDETVTGSYKVLILSS